jgi:hypothetical protein
LRGVELRGTAVVRAPQGDLQGEIVIAAADAAHCRVTITLGPAVLHREYTAVLNGKRAQVSGPAGVVESAPLPVAPGLGCALLPAAIAGSELAAAGAALYADAQGVARRLSWKPRGRAAEVVFTDYAAAAGTAYARTVTESLDGVTVLTVHLESGAPRAFAENDFVLPPPPALPPLKKSGGAR